MKISELVKNLEKIKKEYGDLELVYSSDSEGNRFEKCYYSPGVGYWNENDGEWVSKKDADYWKEQGGKVNSVCVN